MIEKDINQLRKFKVKKSSYNVNLRGNCFQKTYIIFN
jgi:hypothetical protein